MRVIHRTAPYPHESLNGFLGRVAHANRFNSVPSLLVKLMGSQIPPLHKQLPELAQKLCCTSQELSMLFGFRGRQGTMICWHLSSKIITKINQYGARYSAVCPLCIGEQEIVQGIWDVCLYTACHIHDCELIDHCSCGAPLNWRRTKAHLCDICGSNLSTIHSNCVEEEHIQLVSNQLASYWASTSNHPPIKIQHALLREISMLDLDTFINLINLLGHVLPSIAEGHAPSGRFMPNKKSADTIITKAFDIFQHWPDKLFELLDQVARQNNSTSSASYVDKSFRSFHRILHCDASLRAIPFLRQAFELYVEDFWRKTGRTHAMKIYGRQLQLFDIESAF